MAVNLYLSLTSSPSSPRVQINVPEEATGADLRKLSSEATSIPITTMKLIYRGRVIADKETGEVLKEFKLENDSVIHVMGKPAAAAEQPAPSSSATTTTAGASFTPSSAAAPAATDASPLASALMTLRTSNSNDTYRTALTTADKLLKNIITHPMEEKYRTIKKANPAFNKRLGGVTGGEALLLASGFVIETVEGNEVYVLRPSAQAWPRLVAAGEEVARKVAEINTTTTQASNNFAAAAPSIPAPAPSNNAFSGMPGMSGMGGMPGGADMNAMQQMMNDPNMMQNMMGMMNNPMVQNMMRNDPRFANNPMAQRALDELQRNPEMLSQVSQMMSDPTMRANMNRMMEQQQQQSGAGGANPFGGGGTDDMRRQMEQFQRMSQQLGGGGSGSGTGAPSTSNQSGNNGSNNGQNDNEMTEEEMIAEAIRRSLGES